jgi:exodeoxyribonuclease VII large subunit
MEVVCRGRISLYEPRGEYQLVIDTLEERGTGSLQLAFVQLKEKLAREGLFAAERKKPLPLLPEKVSLITSPQGAALHDFLKIAGQRFASLPLEIVPVRVQGSGAAEDVAEAIRLCNERGRSDVIVLCRGGGSIEDLWAFNEEKVARAVAESRIPVVSAIGHESDFTIADFVADFRAPTPTAAAEAVIPDQALLLAGLRRTSVRLTASLLGKLADLRQAVRTSRRILGDPTSLLDHFRLATDHGLASLQFALQTGMQERRLQLEKAHHLLTRQSPEQHLVQQHHFVRELRRRLGQGMDRCLERNREKFAKHAGLLDAVSPLAVLGRGYAIVRRSADGTVVRCASDVEVGKNVTVILRQGELFCRVTGRRPQEDVPD